MGSKWLLPFFLPSCIDDQSWVLEAGDALYLPPRLAHYGLSMDEVCCLHVVAFVAVAFVVVVVLPEDVWISEVFALHHDEYLTCTRLPHVTTRDADNKQECMTYSIGFRAPSTRNLVRFFGDHVASVLTKSDSFYTDPDLQLQQNPGE